MLEWVAISCRGLPNLPWVEPVSPASPCREIVQRATWEAPSSAVVLNKVFFAYLILSDGILILTSFN